MGSKHYPLTIAKLLTVMSLLAFFISSAVAQTICPPAAYCSTSQKRCTAIDCAVQCLSETKGSTSSCCGSNGLCCCYR
ncbi:unnamed protein product [Spirodela intermedia]|uniref:Uncharacterized protein n=1 Tax=Spirodela intermedia TaxID=51605 RepID=A0A7I8J010_SPIIN|nr:unnamed protein product [Spirodela intermedia]CAA6663555.1 unnamed protein product [Spirodela intermedia]